MKYLYFENGGVFLLLTLKEQNLSDSRGLAGFDGKVLGLRNWFC